MNQITPADTCEKQQLLSSIREEGWYLDQRLQDGYFMEDLRSQSKTALKIEHMFLLEDSMINSMVKDGTMMYNTLCNFVEFR